jgi:hypothetical protein
MGDQPSKDLNKQEVSIAQAITQGITEGMTALATSLKPQGPLDMAGFTAEHIKQLTQPPAPQMYRDIPWKSEETGATAIAHVVASKKYPNGRVIYLSNYKHPKEAYVYQAQDGKVPDGFNIWADRPVNLPENEEPAQGTFNQGFLQWRWTNFYQADIRRYVGREIQPHHCQTPEGIKTPWIEGKVGAVNE